MRTALIVLLSRQPPLQPAAPRRRVGAGARQPVPVRIEATGGVGVAEDLFLKLDGIPGESRDAKHKDEIELVAFSWGVTQSGRPGGGGGGGSGRAQFKDFEFLMRVNKASPQLFLATVTGKHIKQALLSVRRAGKAQLEYLKIKFTDVLVTSFAQAGGQNPPDETVAFNFAKIELEYTQQQPRGGPAPPIRAGWDLSRNTKI
jgi:type VI secretion system secreted protein Hcp